jgi:hypothetical protein
MGVGFRGESNTAAVEGDHWAREGRPLRGEGPGGRQ